MNKNLIRIDYHSNPNYPKDSNHLGLNAHLTGQDYKEFTDLNEALMFWFECGNPITPLCAICDEDWCSRVNKACKQEVEAQPKELEEYIKSQRDSYELVENE
jgi:hypothetical protein